MSAWDDENEYPIGDDMGWMDELKDARRANPALVQFDLALDVLKRREGVIRQAMASEIGHEPTVDEVRAIARDYLVEITHNPDGGETVVMRHRATRRVIKRVRFYVMLE